MSIDLTLPKEKRILLAAEEIFSKYGYEKATLDEIISLADVGKGTVYKYYGNKEQLFYKLIQEKNEQYIIALQNAVSSQETLQGKIYAYLVEMITFYKKYANLWQTIYFEMLGGHHGAMVCIENGMPVVKSTYAMEVSEELKERMLRYHTILDDAFVIMRKLLADATDAGKLKISDDVIRTNYFLCGIAMVIFHDRDKIAKSSVEEIAAICADRFLHGEKIH
ncbi:MAG: TetR/AcrR family transcriptional regulator [Phascolarctobacterium sp.]|nr:TetR/AcrR family transcriptional regulator [Phascolarctobacterium sp.]